MKRMAYVFLLIAAVAVAGPSVGGRVGYTTSDDPFTGLSADGPIFGGQLFFPVMPVLGLEISGTYTSAESDVSMEGYLANYLRDEYGYEYSGNIQKLRSYLENDLGWSIPAEADMLKDYRATYHNLGLAGILRADIPMGSSPFKPYVGGGGGVHFVVSDADAMLAMLKQRTTGDPAIDPYDHIFPSAEGVIGMSFKPAGVPASLFGEIRLSKPFGDNAGEAIVSYFGGANLGF
jgi:hypothetical protein